MTSLLDRLIPAPRLSQVDHVDVAAPPERVWRLVRHGNLARSRIIRALFELRAIPERLAGKHQPASLLIDDLRSTPEKPGFAVLLEDEPNELAVGAIGKVWRPVIPFTYVADAAAFLDFSQPDQIKVAWSIRVSSLDAVRSRVEVEVRVDATDAEAFRKFQRYFRLIGPASHFIRRSLLKGLARELAGAEPARSPDGRVQLARPTQETRDESTNHAIP